VQWEKTLLWRGKSELDLMPEASSWLCSSDRRNLRRRVARKNAVAVWMYFFRDDAPNGIAQLKREADKSNDKSNDPAVRRRSTFLSG
jgi:hypothetical protein